MDTLGVPNRIQIRGSPVMLCARRTRTMVATIPSRQWYSQTVALEVRRIAVDREIEITRRGKVERDEGGEEQRSSKRRRRRSTEELTATPAGSLVDLEVNEYIEAHGKRETQDEQ